MPSFFYINVSVSFERSSTLRGSGAADTSPFTGGGGGTNDSGAARVNFQAFTEKLLSFYMDAKLMKISPGLLASPKGDCLRK